MLTGVHEDKDNQETVFISSAAGILVIGFLTSFMLVKDKKISRIYANNDEGKPERVKEVVHHDEDPNDTGSDLDLGLQAGVYATKSKSLSFCQ